MRQNIRIISNGSSQSSSTLATSAHKCSGFLVATKSWRLRNAISSKMVLAMGGLRQCVRLGPEATIAFGLACFLLVCPSNTYVDHKTVEMQYSH
eukprot:scaffold275181_cov33-Prasinocladus_malaysianus.AAC.1